MKIFKSVKWIGVLTSMVFILVLSCKKDPEVSQPISNIQKPTPYNLVLPNSLKNLQTFIPKDNPLTVEGVNLGRYLFYDSLLSEDYTMSCGSCHRQENAFSDAPNQFSKGILGMNGTRNSIALFNTIFENTGFFWDGRVTYLESQILQPVTELVEMHNTWQNVIDRVAKNQQYMTWYKIAFGTDQVSKENIARSIAQFLRTIVSGNSKFDRGNLSVQEKNGRTLFGDFPRFDSRTGIRTSGGLDCAHCHAVPLFTPENRLPTFMNNGMGTTNFKAVSLRNIMKTFPYMHDGSLSNIDSVINHYRDVKVTPQLNQNMWIIMHTSNIFPGVKPNLNISAQERSDLIAFLNTLTDDSLTVKKEYSNPFRK